MEELARRQTEQVPDIKPQKEHSLETPVMDTAEVMSCAKVFGLESEKISPKEKQMLE